MGEKKKSAEEARAKAEEQEAKSLQEANKRRVASLDVKVEHIRKMRSEHQTRASHEKNTIDGSKREAQERDEQEKLNLFGHRAGAAGAEVRRTVEVASDDREAAMKADQEEKVHELKVNEREGKTRREADMVRQGATERASKTDREKAI